MSSSSAFPCFVASTTTDAKAGNSNPTIILNGFQIASHAKHKNWIEIQWNANL
jgi:hypothetical protein